MTDRPAPPVFAENPAAPRRRRWRIALPVLLVGFAILASLAYILWVVREVQDQQIPMLSYGFAALGVSFAAAALGSLIAVWRAASRAQGGRSFGLALVGGLAGLAAIGSFSVMALLLMLLNS